MKVKTSISISQDVLKTIDSLAGSARHRSDFIEAALRAYIALKIRQRQNEHDLEILNRNADRLNKEAEDILDYQVEL